MLGTLIRNDRVGYDRSEQCQSLCTTGKFRETDAAQQLGFLRFWDRLLLKPSADTDETNYAGGFVEPETKPVRQASLRLASTGERQNTSLSTR